MPIWGQFGACVLIWGCTWIAITTQIHVVPGPWSVCYRFLLAGAVLWLIARLREGPQHITLRQHGFFFCLGMVQFAFNFWLVYESEKYVTSGLVAVSYALMAITNPLFASLLLKQRLFTRHILAGAVFGISGVFLMFRNEIQDFSLNDHGALGLGLAFAGVLCATLGNIIAASPTAKAAPTSVVISYAMLYGAILSLFYAFITSGPPTISWTLPYLGGLLFLALFGSVVAFSLYFNVVRTLGVAIAAYTGVLVPIVALAISTIFEDFTWTVSAILGAFLALLGTAIAVLKRKPNP
jgi:drug/metabolite transporter (DMT)-like permease